MSRGRKIAFVFNAGFCGSLSACACVCIIYVRAAQTFCFAQQKYRMTNEWNKWKNHFYEMKGDVGMSLE